MAGWGAREPATGTAPATERMLRRLELRVVRRLEGLLHGQHQGLLPGAGSEPAEARTYQPGEDDVRRMDWNVTARTTVPHVRDLVADRELETWALVDLSASMDFGTVGPDKRELAVAALAAVGFLTGRSGNRFGALVLHAGGVASWPARTGRAALYGLLRSLLAAERPAPGGRPLPLASAVEALARGRRRRGLRVVVSDFLDPVGPDGVFGWEPPLRQLAARHQVDCAWMGPIREGAYRAAGSDQAGGDAGTFRGLPRRSARGWGLDGEGLMSRPLQYGDPVQLGAFRLVDRVGESPAGVVYRATDPRGSTWSWARSSSTSCSPTRSTAPRPRCSPRSLR